MYHTRGVPEHEESTFLRVLGELPGDVKAGERRDTKGKKGLNATRRNLVRSAGRVVLDCQRNPVSRILSNVPLSLQPIPLPYSVFKARKIEDRGKKGKCESLIWANSTCNGVTEASYKKRFQD